MDLFRKLSVTCPHCRSPKPGERARVGDRVVTLCYCNTCGVTWTREDAPGTGTADQKRRSRERAKRDPVQTEPAGTDLLLGGSFADGYELVEVASGHRVAANLSSLDEVLAAARVHGGQLWQQQIDRFGHPMGKPIRLSLQTQ